MGEINMYKLVRLMQYLCVLFGVGIVFNVAQVSAEEIDIIVEATSGDEVQEADIQQALNMARDDSDNSYKITVPKGDYEINGLHIYSNTHLIIKGCTFRKEKPYRVGALIQVGYPRKETKKYGVWGELGDGYYWGKYSRGENIIIEGGVFDAGTSTENISTLCTFSHVQNITFKNVTSKYKPKKKTNKHLIEFGASKNVTLDGCKFIGNQNCGEAVQIESAVNGVAGSELMGKLDGTKTLNIVVKNCKFTNFEYGIGTNHGCSKDT